MILPADRVRRPPRPKPPRARSVTQDSLPSPAADRRRRRGAELLEIPHGYSSSFRAPPPRHSTAGLRPESWVALIAAAHLLAHGSARMTPAEVRLLHAAARELGVDVGYSAVDRLARFLDAARGLEPSHSPDRSARLPSLVRNHAIDSLAPRRAYPRTGLVIDVVVAASGFGNVIGVSARTLETR